MQPLSPQFGLQVAFIEKSAKRMLRTHNDASWEEAESQVRDFQKAAYQTVRARKKDLKEIPDTVRLVFMYHPDMEFARLSRDGVMSNKGKDDKAAYADAPVVETASVVWPDARYSMWTPGDSEDTSVANAVEGQPVDTDRLADLKRFVNKAIDGLIREWQEIEAKTPQQREKPNPFRHP